MKRKVLIITPFLMQGGVEHSLITALSGIDYSLFDITLYLYKEDLTLLSDVPKEVNVIMGFDKTHYYRKPKSVVFLALCKVAKIFGLKKLDDYFAEKLSEYIHKKKVNFPNKKFFQKKEFDVVISYCLHIGTEMALTINANKHYLFLHNSLTDYHSDIFKKCYKEFDSIIAVSEGVKRVYLNEYSDIKNIKVIDNYVNANEIIEKAKAFDVHPINDDVFICTCGRLAKEKGFDLAVGAVNFLKKAGYNVNWIFVGGGYYKNELDNMIDRYDLNENILITGTVDNPYPYIKACDIYVQPSYEESQGLTIYEALILDKAVVSTNTVGGQCTLKNGEYGLLTDINERSIAEGIIKICDNPDLKSVFENVNVKENNETAKEKYYQSWNKLLYGEL